MGEDLAKNYEALAKRHSEEIVQILEEFGDNQIETSLDLQSYEAECKRVEQG